MNLMQRYNVAILGCGAIFSRHLAAIKANAANFNLIGLYDPNSELLHNYSKELNVVAYNSQEEIYNDSRVDCVILLTPSNLHFTQALAALHHGKNLIIEKPASFLSHQINELEQEALLRGLHIFTILQVRLNKAFRVAKQFIAAGHMGNMRGVSLIQRWQRPVDYFCGWRGSMVSGGGILREFGIHYLDIMQQLAGNPKVTAASFFKTKIKATDVSDTVYALLDFGEFGGSCEISMAAEPRNLECSLTLLSDRGIIKLGGKSLDEIVCADFLECRLLDYLEQAKEQVANEDKDTVFAAVGGASPYHPELYRQIIINPQRFALGQTYAIVKLIEEIYAYE